MKPQVHTCTNLLADKHTQHTFIHTWTGYNRHNQGTYTDTLLTNTEKHVFTQRCANSFTWTPSSPNTHSHAGIHTHTQTKRCFLIGLTWIDTFTWGSRYPTPLTYTHRHTRMHYLPIRTDRPTFTHAQSHKSHTDRHVCTHLQTHPHADMLSHMLPGHAWSAQRLQL